MKPLLFESQPTTINLAIASEKLQSLMQEGKLNLADFHCLDPKSKKSVWGMLRSLAASVL
jgi:hypothetical protein